MYRVIIKSKLVGKKKKTNISSENHYDSCSSNYVLGGKRSRIGMVVAKVIPLHFALRGP